MWQIQRLRRMLCNCLANIRKCENIVRLDKRSSDVLYLQIHSHSYSTWSYFTNGQSKTLSHCLRELTAFFEENQISEAEQSAEYITAFALGHKTLHRVNRDFKIDCNTLEKISTLAEKRLQNMPVQYVIGEWDFRDLTVICRPPVFIPRPETEELVSYALEDPVVRRADNFLEIGPGTGAIALSLLTALPQLKATVIDRSSLACELTMENAKVQGVADRIDVINATFCSGSSCLLSRLLMECGKFDFLISNPPYLSSNEMADLQPEILWYEDIMSLVAGQDGLDVIKEILKVAGTKLVRPGGSIWLEVNTSHPSKIRELLSQHPEHKLEFFEKRDDQRTRNSRNRDNMVQFCHLRAVI